MNTFRFHNPDRMDVANYYPTTPLENLQGSYSIVSKVDGNNLHGGNRLETCRDRFLTQAFTLAKDGKLRKPCKVVLVLRKNTNTDTMNFGYGCYSWLKPEEITLEVLVEGKYTKVQALVFNVDMTGYLAPTYFWCLTNDLRAAFTGIYKVNKNLYPHNSPTYSAWENALRSRDTYSTEVGINNTGPLTWCNPRVFAEQEERLKEYIKQLACGEQSNPGVPPLSQTIMEANNRVFKKSPGNPKIAQFVRLASTVNNFANGKYTINRK